MQESASLHAKGGNLAAAPCSCWMGVHGQLFWDLCRFFVGSGAEDGHDGLGYQVRSKVGEDVLGIFARRHKDELHG